LDQWLLAAALATLNGGLPATVPDAVGMSAPRLEAISHVVTRGITAGGYPGAAVVVGRKGYAVLQKGFGALSWTKTSEKVVADQTIYDLASLTKVVATTTAVMILYDEGKIALDEPVKTYFPEFSGGLKDKVTVRQLLTHHSGLPPGRDIWRMTHDPAEARRLVIATPLICPPGKCYEYSDAGADILGMMVESVSGTTLDKFVAERVFKPLGMNDTFFRPSAELRARIAPTEVMPPRGYPLRGEVHDENAFVLGGVAGHAGLFSTATDLAVFAQMMLNGGRYGATRIVSDSAVALFTKRVIGARALGWETGNGEAGAGEFLSERAYGHTGFTGTSMWIDPDRNMFVILLTNRVHAARARRPSAVIADVRNDLADAAVLAVLDSPDGVHEMPVAFRADKALGWNSGTRRPVVTASKGKTGSSAANAAKRPATSSRPPATTSAQTKATATKTAGGPSAQAPPVPVQRTGPKPDSSRARQPASRGPAAGAAQGAA
jgi:CubicO group peptidase (beta-lactamase class C family)